MKIPLTTLSISFSFESVQRGWRWLKEKFNAD